MDYDLKWALRRVEMKRGDDLMMPYQHGMQAMADRIAELEKVLRTVSIIDLGFGAPTWFCAGCVSYGDGCDSIPHKDGCIIAQTLGL